MTEHLLAGAGRRAGPCTTRAATSATPAASASWPTSPAAPAGPSSTPPSASSNGSVTGARSPPTPGPATARASWCRCPPGSSPARTPPGLRPARRGHGLPPARPLRRQGGPPGGRAGAGRRGAGAAPLAPGPGRPRRHRRGGQGKAPAIEQAVFQAARGGRRGGRAALLPGRPAGHRGRQGRRGAAVPRLLLDPDGHLQGAVRGRPARRLLPGPGRPRVRGLVRRVPPALLDQHHAVLGARPAVPVPLPQRRDQHSRRQRRLDAGP